MRSVFLLKCIVFKPYTMWSLRIRENIKTFLNLKVCKVQKASENKLHQRRQIFPDTKPRQYTVKLITFLWIQKKIGRTSSVSTWLRWAHHVCRPHFPRNQGRIQIAKLKQTHVFFKSSPSKTWAGSTWSPGGSNEPPELTQIYIYIY